MNKLRRFLTIGVMAITVLATVGAYIPASEASASAGDLIKMDGLSSVYYLGSDGKRYVFPNTETYMSWYNDFSGVVTIPASELQSYPLGGNVTMRPGTKLVKITTDPSVYAVEPNGVLRKIQSEAQAAALYGSNWNKRVVDVADAFFTNYTISSALPSGSVPAGSLVKSSTGATVYYYDGSSYRAIADESAFNANRFSFSNVITVSSIATTGTAVSSAEFVNVAQNGATTGVVVTGSGLMVSLNSSTPAAASVPMNGSRIPMAKVNLTAASDGAVTVNSITVKRIGLSSYNDIDKVWAEQNGVSVASKKTVNSNDESILTFSPALTVNAGQTVVLDILASFKQTSAAGNIGLSIVSASAVSATAASVTGSFPISGNLMSPTNYSVTEVKLTTTDSSKEAYVGDEDFQLGKFDVEFAGNSRDISLKSIMLKNSGDEDLAKTLMNVYLENKGNKVATGVMSGKYITFTFANGGLNMLKDDGDQSFYIKGDVIAKENAGTSGITLSLNKTEDFSANEITNGFGVKVQDASTIAVATVNMKAGAIAVTKKSTSPSDTTVIKSAKSVVALIANLKADEAINADGLRIDLDQMATTSFENIRVYVNSVLVDSFDELPVTSPATTTKLLDSSVSLNQGNNEIKVLVDVKSNATSSDKFQVSINKSSDLLDAPEYVTTGNSVSASEVTGSATGAIFTVGGAALSATRSDGYGSKTVVKGTTDISLGKFTVKATDDTVKITSIAVASTSGNTVSHSNLYDFKLYVDGTQIGTTKDFTSTGAYFSSLNLSVASNNTKIIELKGSADNSASGTIAVKLTFTAEDSNGKTVTVSDTPTSASFAVVDNGTLDIAKDGDSPVSAILVSKAAEQAIATFKLTATNDSANLTELFIVNASSTATSTCTTTDARISAYKLYVEGNSTAIDTVTPYNGEAKFTISNNSVIVPADGSKKIIVKAVLNNIENDASATDAYLKVQINSYKFKSSNGTETPITGKSITGNEFRIRKTAPTIALLALPSTTLTSGNQTVAKFTVSADANADVKVSRIVLNYSSSSVTSLATTSNPVKINGTAKTDNVTSTLDASTITVDFGTSTPEIVSAGTSKTFEIIVNPTVNSSATRASFSTSLLEAAYSAGYGTSFSWTDSASNNDANNIWFNSWRVNGLPSDTQTLTAN